MDSKLWRSLSEENKLLKNLTSSDLSKYIADGNDEKGDENLNAMAKLIMIEQKRSLNSTITEVLWYYYFVCEKTK